MAYGNYAPFYRGGYFNPMQTQQMPSMVENPQFTQTYQQPIQNNPMQMPVMPTQMSVANDMIWVLGQTEAESYLVAPNNSVVLWDKNNPTIYVKSVNAQGMPSMRILDFTERNADASISNDNVSKTHKCTCGDKYATKEQINDLRAKLEELTAKYEQLTPHMEEKQKNIKKSKESEE